MDMEVRRVIGKLNIEERNPKVQYLFPSRSASKNIVWHGVEDSEDYPEVAFTLKGKRTDLYLWAFSGEKHIFSVILNWMDQIKL